jgi:hypothetical protein
MLLHFLKKNSTHHFNISKQDPTIEFQKRKKKKRKEKNQFMQVVLEVAVLECSFLKHGQRVLGVKSFVHSPCISRSYKDEPRFVYLTPKGPRKLMRSLI